MVGARPGKSGQLARRALFCAFALALPACALVLGLDEGTGIVQEDAAVARQGGPDGSDDATMSNSSDPDSTGAVGLDGRVQGPPPAADGCTPDPAWCDTHCGTGPDNCGQERQCPSNCAAGNGCTGNTCMCQPEASWCNGRCGMTTDNCNNPINCGTCAGGDSSTACTPETYQQACGARKCGQATNNCGQLVNCGTLGLTSTCFLQVCLADGRCCSPNSASACGNKCGTFATDNCGQAVQCPSSCGAGLVCYQKSCCTPTNPCGGACGVSLVNNCGQTIQCGCSGSQECVATTSKCCTPQGCAGNCVDSCGLPASSCCAEAGPLDAQPESGETEGEAPDAAAE